MFQIINFASSYTSIEHTAMKEITDLMVFCLCRIISGNKYVHERMCVTNGDKKE